MIDLKHEQNISIELEQKHEQEKPKRDDDSFAREVKHREDRRTIYYLRNGKQCKRVLNASGYSSKAERVVDVVEYMNQNNSNKINMKMMKGFKLMEDNYNE